MTTTVSPLDAQIFDQPLPGASFGKAVRRFWTKYATFTGRASRSEFWWWWLANLLISLVLSGIAVALSGGIDSVADSKAKNLISALWSLATLLPWLALNARRLHDTNRSGWWQLLHLVPVVGTIIVYVWCASAPKPAGVRFDHSTADPAQRSDRTEEAAG